MKKQDFLELVTQARKTNLVSETELLTAFQSDTDKKLASNDAKTTSSTGSTRPSIAKILSFLGGLIVVIGIVILVSDNWELLSSIQRIALTSGSALAALLSGLQLMRREETELPAMAAHIIAGLLIPTALLVIVYELGSIEQNYLVLLGMGLIGLSMYGPLTWLFKKTVFMFFSIVFATWSYHYAAAMLIENFWTETRDFSYHSRYEFLVVSVIYICLAWIIRRSYPAIKGWLESVATLIILGITISFTGSGNFHELFWEIGYPFVIMVMLYLSVILKNKVVLIFSTLFLMGYIIKITSEYFANILGWPIALVIIGLAMIGIGYGMVQLNRKYLTQKST